MKIKYILCALSIVLSSMTLAQRTELEITNAIQILSNFDDNVGGLHLPMLQAITSL